MTDSRPPLPIPGPASAPSRPLGVATPATVDVYKHHRADDPAGTFHSHCRLDDLGFTDNAVAHQRYNPAASYLGAAPDIRTHRRSDDP